MLNISVEIDPVLLPSLDCVDKITTTRTLSINVFKLIYSIGNIQSRRFAPSNRQKYTDKSDLIESLVQNTNDFKVRIASIRDMHGSETLKSISEDLGVGVSVCVAMLLYNIKYSTIQRIYGNDKRPDWSCQLQDNRILIVESKGASSHATSYNQERNAVIQKSRRTGDVKIASLTVFKENQISENRLLDPPINPDNMNADLQNKVLRAGHYSSVFSFLGHSILSKYFSQMRKRLLNEITNEEQRRKDLTFFHLRDEYSRINYQHKNFVGTFYLIHYNKYLFIGVDINLISFEGFNNFIDYTNEFESTIEENHYMLFPDGILIIEIDNISIFRSQVNIENIINYQEYNSISDIDSMTELSFEKYILYLLLQLGFEVSREVRIEDRVVDIVARLYDKRYFIELKLFKHKPILSNLKEQFQRIQNNIRGQVVFITNVDIPEDFISPNANTVLIGRNKLKQILKDKNLLKEAIIGTI